MNRNSITASVTAEDFGSIKVYGESEPEYPAGICVDTHDGYAEMHVTREQAITLRDALSKIIAANN